MDSQGRSRFIVGGLALSAVILVISLLLSQQSSRSSFIVESPLPNPTVTLRMGDSPLAVSDSGFGGESPLSRPGVAGVADSQSITSGWAITAQSLLSAPIGVTSLVTSSDISSGISSAVTAITTTVISTVTVSFVEAPTTHYGYEVVARYPHDPSAFTQGLQYIDGVLYEGTGLYGRSSLRRVELESGVVQQQFDLAPEYFGEGIYVLGDRIYQLTWKSNVAFLYDRASFALLDQFSYPTEGWGLTYDGEYLVMSDGTSTLFLRDPETFEEVGRFTVHDGDVPVDMLNELEYVNGSIWANIWLTDEIVIIDPASGQIIGRVDFTGLLPSDDAANADVLNGIAYDAERDRLFVTGKLWPTLFEIELVPQ